MKDFISIIFWIYLITNEFFYSVDNYFISKNIPVFYFIFKYKFIFLLLIMSIMCILNKPLKTLFVSIYIIFYPFILIFFKGGKLIHKKNMYSILIYSISNLISFFLNLRHKAVGLFIFIMSVCSLLFSRVEFFQYIGMLFSFILIFYSYSSVVYSSFREPEFYSLVRKAVSFVSKKTVTIEILSEAEEDKQCILVESKGMVAIKDIHHFIFVGSSYKFLSETIKNRSSPFMLMATGTTVVIYLIFISVFSFFIMNYSLWNINKEEFLTSQSVGAFDFFYYSFKGLIFADIDSVKANLNCAKSIQMFNNFIGLMLVIVFVIIVYSSRSETYSKINKETYELLDKEGDRIYGNLLTTLNARDYEELSGIVSQLNDITANILKFFIRK